MRSHWIANISLAILSLGLLWGGPVVIDFALNPERCVPGGFCGTGLKAARKSAATEALLFAPFFALGTIGFLCFQARLSVGARLVGDVSILMGAAYLAIRLWDYRIVSWLCRTF